MARKRAKRENVPTPRVRGGPSPAKLLADLRDLIRSARSGVAQAVNSLMALHDWVDRLGETIEESITDEPIIRWVSDYPSLAAWKPGKSHRAG